MLRAPTTRSQMVAKECDLRRSGAGPGAPSSSGTT